MKLFVSKIWFKNSPKVKRQHSHGFNQIFCEDNRQVSNEFMGLDDDHPFPQALANFAIILSIFSLFFYLIYSQGIANFMHEFMEKLGKLLQILIKND
ncbi:MAG: hypothetical protein HOP23_11385 [Methylococcaceae bacterium]|nr:hypothetical protein [Methylococcaceae bacterium]